MDTRVGQVWEWKSFMNGERVVVVMESKLVTTRSASRAMIHKVLYLTGKKFGRVLMCTEDDTLPWEMLGNMSRLD